MFQMYENDDPKHHIKTAAKINLSEFYENFYESMNQTTTIDYNQLIEMDVRDKITVGSVLMFLFELPILVVGQSFCIIFLVILKRTRCFHQNLRLLLGNFTLSFLMVILSRYFIITPLLVSYMTNEVFGNQMWCRSAKALHDTGIYVGALDMIVLVAERTIATVFVRTYEKTKTRCCGLILISLQWVFALLFVIFNQTHAFTGLSFYRLPCQREFLSLVAVRIFMWTILASNMVAIIVFIVLLHINKNRYNYFGTEFSNKYLSERYQIAENVKTTRLLYPLMLAYFLVSSSAIIMFIVSAFVHKKILGTSDLERFKQTSYVGHLFDIELALLSIVFPHLAVYGHHSLLREFKKIFAPRNPSIRVPDMPKRLDGKQLIMNSAEERELHFTNLQSQWNDSKKLYHKRESKISLTLK